MVRSVDTSANARWKERYRAVSVYSYAIAPLAPERGLISTNRSGSLQFFAWEVPTGKLRQLTHTPSGHSSGLALSPDGQWAYYLKDERGNEIGHYARIPYEGGEPQDITPGMPPYSSFGIWFSRTGTRLGFTVAGRRGFSAYIADVAEDGSLGGMRKLYDMKTIGFGPMLSADGAVAVAMSSERSGRNEFSLLAFRADSGERIGELWDGEGSSISLQRFSPRSGDPRLLACTNRSGIERLVLWDPISGERTDLDLDIPGSQGVEDWSPNCETVIVTTLDRAVQSLYLHHLPTGETRKLETQDGEYRARYTPDGEHLYASWGDASHNPRLVELDPHSGAMKRTLLSLSEPPVGRPMRSVIFSSSDGQEIQGWLCLPEGVGPHPTILQTHGGPASVRTNGFDPGAQSWVDHGFAFLSINYRGSVTFGRTFEQKIWHDLGHWEVEDMVAAREFLLREGIARPGAIFLTGWSYGGYLTLLGLGKCPELWAGGMAGVAIADWAIQWEETADTLRGYQEALFGGTPREVPERYAASSPITYAEKVQAPVLIIQGRNDTRTPPRPVVLYEKRMKELGKEITLHWFDTGHAGSFADTEIGIGHQQMMLSFACAVLAKGENA